MTDTTPFDPIAFNFVKLTDFEFFGGIAVYKIKNHRAVNGAHDFCRLNLYLSKHEDFVTIWWGLLEAMLTEAKFENVALPADFDFYAAYDEKLFRGYIETNEIAAVVLNALRVTTSAYYARPQVLSVDSDNGLRCDLIEAA